MILSRPLVWGCALGFLVPAWASAAIVFQDGFESGVSGSVWQAVPGVANVQILNADTAHVYSGTKAAKQVNADPFVYYMKTNDNYWSAGVIQTGETVIASCKFFDDNTLYDTSNTARGGGLLVGSSQNVNNGVLNDFYQLLVNSTRAEGGNGQRYLIRSSLNGYADSGITRSQGWHDFRIEVGSYTGGQDVRFYIDNVLAGTRQRRASTGQGFPIDDVRVGLSVKSPGLAFWYDDVSVSKVPEPASMLLLALGGLFLRRR